jgi:uncharacterized protein (DUF488 family)
MIALGHSTTTIEKFLDALELCGVRVLADVRTVPKSRHNPQFETNALSASLVSRGIVYVWLQELGGFRRALPDSVNGGWRKASFRGYADYMQTAEFRAGLQHLLELGPPDVTAFMCSEAVPWRCHRSLIADALLARGVKVEQMMITAKGPVLKPHKLTPFAKVAGDQVTYPPEQPELPL